MTQKMEVKWGIIVAVGTDPGECESSSGETDRQDGGGRPSALECASPVPIALGSVWRVLESVPFLYLVTPLGAREYIFEPGADGTGGSYQMKGLHRSVDAATREYKEFGPSVRLVLVHLDTPDRFLHPGLLPWLSRFAPNFVPEDKKLLRISELLSKCLDESRDDAVFVATLASCKSHDWLQSPWKELMNSLQHRDLPVQ